MKILCDSNKLTDYFIELEDVNFSHPVIQQFAASLFRTVQSDTEMVNKAFTFVRDDIDHSFDINNRVITCKASDVLLKKHGICYAKSHLLAALLRSQQIPTGFCYQRLTLFDSPEDGYCIHALNAVFIPSASRWIRVDARGNKDGINAQFSLEAEQLAFAVRPHLGEIDYPMIYARPHPKTLHALNTSYNCQTMYKEKLPTFL
ncbi:transglutaminase-like domain-containing protein [Bacillus alkalicellulosilyticus]|uniref:transglutaminase-like domain-containing protein n=1 Tax=Alkalihalobacterium alkalicellulosilyticum TaxID=1912214 RepID=UPI000998DE3A|nr:transglutaminase family protein [Bacillus alkalicellulosilyticus]